MIQRSGIIWSKRATINEVIPLPSKGEEDEEDIEDAEE